MSATTGRRSNMSHVNSRAVHAPAAAASGAASPAVITVALTRPLVGHLNGVARRLTGGDFEALVLWCEVAHSSVAHLLAPGADSAALLDCLARLAAEPALARPTTLRDLTAVTGIPRETARRKLDRLVAQGHLRREAAGWVIGPERSPLPASP
jgi:IclR helix-turn-helix domain